MLIVVLEYLGEWFEYPHQKTWYAPTLVLKLQEHFLIGTGVENACYRGGGGVSGIELRIL